MDQKVLDHKRILDLSFHTALNLQRNKTVNSYSRLHNDNVSVMCSWWLEHTR